MADHLYPEQDITESFFMTNLLEPIMTSQQSKHSFDGSYVSIQNWFQATEQMLQHRRQRAIVHNRRMKEIEQEFERRKELKLKSIEEKIQTSQQNKHKGMTMIQDRLRKISDRRNKVNLEVKHREYENLQKNLQERKSYEPGGSHSRGSSSRGSKTSSSEDRIQVKIRQIQEAQLEIKNKLQDYKQKQEHAKDKNLYFSRVKAERAKSHNSIQVPEIKQRASLVKANRVRAQSQDAIARLSTLDVVRQNKHKREQQFLQKKIKYNSEKIRRFQNNLLDLNEKQRRRCAELDDKNDKIVTKNPWKDPRKISQNKRIIENLHSIEIAQKIKTERIIQKHRQIEERNKHFRERRDFLYQNYKNQTIS